jgi:antitoxin HigA-1
MNLPSIPAHPGKILLEQAMAPLGVSRNKLARDIDVPVGRISDIVNGKRGITADTALRLAKYFGTSADLWMRLQAEYDLHVATQTVWAQIEPRVRVFVPVEAAAPPLPVEAAPPPPPAPPPAPALDNMRPATTPAVPPPVAPDLPPVVDPQMSEAPGDIFAPASPLSESLAPPDEPEDSAEAGFEDDSGWTVAEDAPAAAEDDAPPHFEWQTGAESPSPAAEMEDVEALISLPPEPREPAPPMRLDDDEAGDGEPAAEAAPEAGANIAPFPFDAARLAARFADIPAEPPMEPDEASDDPLNDSETGPAPIDDAVAELPDTAAALDADDPSIPGHTPATCLVADELSSPAPAPALAEPVADDGASTFHERAPWGLPDLPQPAGGGDHDRVEDDALRAAFELDDDDGFEGSLDIPEPDEVPPTGTNS